MGDECQGTATDATDSETCRGTTDDEGRGCVRESAYDRAQCEDRQANQDDGLGSEDSAGFAKTAYFLIRNTGTVAGPARLTKE